MAAMNPSERPSRLLRSKAFHPMREPFREHDDLHLEPSRVHGPVPFLNPTKAQFHHTNLSEKLHDLEDEVTPSTSPSDEEKVNGQQSTTGQRASEVSFLWRSRDNRKGRHTISVKSDSSGRYVVPPKTTEFRQIARGILRMFTFFPYWDISWWVAFVFTMGSAVWVINAFFVWLPSVDPSTQFYHEILDGGGITAFLGAIVFFETGSILLFFEALNENSAGCFGWAVSEAVRGEGKAGQVNVVPEKEACIHHHANRSNFVGASSADTHPHFKPSNEATNKGGRTWQWFPTWHDLRTHYLHELGFIAGMAQLFGATIFGISGFTALPGIQNNLSPQWRLNVAYWIPQVVGGSGFIVSGTLYMLETQKFWWTPAWGVLGWHIGFWNWIGAFGFTLSGALGMAYGNSGAQYQAGCATFWGSWAFLIGSLLQWYEALDKHPVVEDLGMDSKFRPG